MAATKEIRNVSLIFDRDHGSENEGWYIRHDEYVDGECLNRACDNGLDCTDANDVEAAIAEAVRYFGGKVSREEIKVVA